MELFFELILSVYCELMFFIVPEEKRASKKYRVIAIIIASVVLFGVIALFIWGCVLIRDYKNYWGIALIALAVIISLAQIFVGFILDEKKSPKE